MKLKTDYETYYTLKEYLFYLPISIKVKNKLITFSR